MIPLLYKLFFILILFNSCGEFNYSPYTTNIKDKNLNDKNLISLNQRNTLFASTFKIAVISDTHDYYKELEKQIKYINLHQDEYAFVIHTGDSTNLGLLMEWEMFYSFLSKLKIPFIVAIGNHDMLTNGENIFKQYFGDKLDFSFVFKQTEFFIINNNNWESSVPVPDLDKLNQSLASSTAVNKIVLSHVAPDDTDRFSSSEISKTKNIINSNNIKYYVNGHNHNYTSTQFGSATNVTVGSSHVGVLLELNISNTGVTHNFIKM